MEKKFDSFLVRPQYIASHAPVSTPEFGMAFAIDRMTIFEVYFYEHSGFQFPIFTTVGNRFIQSKKDWQMCGQCQEEVLSGCALEFFRKWDKAHLKTLPPESYYLMRSDLVAVERAYLGYKRFKPDFNGNWHFKFYELKDLSMKYTK